MKARELIVWCLLLVAIALLFRRCGGNGGGNHPVDTVYIKGETDTLIVRDTITMVIFRNHPKAVSSIPVISEDSGGVTEALSNPCDSVRTYQDSIENKHGKATVGSIIRGELISQQLTLKSYHSDTTFSRVDTISQTFVRQPSFSLSVAGSVDLNNGPGVGVMVGLKRFTVGYQYFPVNKGNQMVIGYSLFNR